MRPRMVPDLHLMPLGTLDRNPPPMFRQGHSALSKLVFFSALAVFLMVADGRFRIAVPLRAGIATALQPLQSALMVPVKMVQGGGAYVQGLDRALAQEDRARRALADQAVQASLAQQLTAENLRLRALLELRPALAVKSISAEVLYEASDPYSRKVVIDRGQVHGVVLGAPVVNEAGVLGQVTRLYPLNAEVSLMTDKEAAIPVLNTRTQLRSVAFGTALGAGVWHAGALSPLDPAAIREDATYAWLSDAGGPQHPRSGVTRPEPDKPGAYTWNKAPRLAGEVVETGAIARQLASGHPLIVDLVGRHGGTVYTRVVARLLELARVVTLMEDWLRALRPGEPFCTPGPLPDEGIAAGLSEAARGSLGHWISVRDGRIANYQIVAPTTWNFSPRDADGRPGALEAALEGAPVRDGETTPVAVQHIVRSFDPCMVCTVH